MILDPVKLKNVVEKNFRNYKIRGWSVNGPDTTDPVTRLKPESEQEAYLTKEVKLFDKDMAITNWSKFDTQNDLISCITQILIDCLTDVSSVGVDTTSQAGTKTVLTLPDGTTTESVAGQVYTTGGNRTPVSNDMVLGSALSNVISLKNGTVNPTLVKIDGTQVLTVRQAAVANSTGLGDIVPQFNLLLAALRTHGLIAP